MQPYAHRPLSTQSSIRVLTLESASDFHAPLRCRLTDVNLNREEISYEALSYVWGSATGTNPLSCEGRELLITPNCESALRHLRFKSRDRNLWVDAICIDQKLKSERGHQVKMMDDIFGKATQVLIWLGDSNSKTALAFAYLRTLYAWYWLPFSGVIIEVLNWKWIGNTTLAQFHQDYMVELCSRPWFERVWTMQELILSRHGLVICGRETISWPAFAAGADMFWSFWEYRNIGKNTHCQGLYHRFWCWEVFQNIPTDPGERHRLVAYLLLSSRSQKCSDLRDKLFALFSLVRKLGFHVSLPDYERSETDLYEEAVIQYIKQYGSLFLLEQSPRSSREDSRLPTWVPDFNREVVFSPLTLAAIPLVSTSKVDTDLLDRRTFRTLPLRGKRLAHVTLVSSGHSISRQSTRDLPHRLTTDSKWDQTLQDWCDFADFADRFPCLSKGETYATSLARLLSRLVDAERKVTILARHQSEPIDPHEALPRPFRTYCERLHSFIKGHTGETCSSTSAVTAVKKLLGRLQSKDGKSTYLVPDEDLAIQGYISRSICEQKLVLTSSMHLGRGPNIVQEQDVIVLFVGARVPFIIRPAGSNYEFVGPVEVQGTPFELDWDLGDVMELEIFTLK